MDSKKSPSGLWKRQSSTPIGDDTTTNAGGGADDSALELASTSGGSVDNAPLLATSSSTQGSGAVANTTTTTTSEILSLSSAELAKITCRDVGLSFAFNFLGSSLTHIFAAAEDEAWRSENVPFQKTAAGDVILDFELNHKLVDPATVSGMYTHIYFGNCCHSCSACFIIYLSLKFCGCLALLLRFSFVKCSCVASH